MESNCLNCHEPLTGEFCSHCGQPANTHRINTHFLWHDLQHGFMHMDKGILFTTKELFTRPGHSIREFLEGKRVMHFKPISMVLILAGIYGFLSHFFQINVLENNYEINGSGRDFNRIKETIGKISEWLSQHYAVIALTQIPIFSVGTYIGFKKSGYNFIEHVVINTFLTSQRIIVHIVSFPLYYLLNGTKTLKFVDRGISLIGYFLIFWSLFQLFNRLPKFQRIWKTVLSLFISFILSVGILVGIFKWAMAYIK
jgi:hypothetical protein